MLKMKDRHLVDGTLPSYTYQCTNSDPTNDNKQPTKVAPAVREIFSLASLHWQPLRRSWRAVVGLGPVEQETDGGCLGSQCRAVFAV